MFLYIILVPNLQSNYYILLSLLGGYFLKPPGFTVSDETIFMLFYLFINETIFLNFKIQQSRRYCYLIFLG